MKTLIEILKKKKLIDYEKFCYQLNSMNNNLSYKNTEIVVKRLQDAVILSNQQGDFR